MCIIFRRVVVCNQHHTRDGEQQKAVMSPLNLHPLDWRQVHRRKFKAFHLWSLRSWSLTNSLTRYTFATSISKSLLAPVRLTIIDSITLHVRVLIGLSPFSAWVASQQPERRTLHGWSVCYPVRIECLRRSSQQQEPKGSQTKFAYNGRVGFVAFSPPVWSIFIGAPH